MLGAVLLAVALALWQRDLSWGLRFGGLAAGVAALLPFIRRGVRPAVVAALAAALLVAGVSLVLSPPGFGVLVTTSGMAGYDLLFVFSERQWLDELERRSG